VPKTKYLVDYTRHDYIVVAGENTAYEGCNEYEARQTYAEFVLAGVPVTLLIDGDVDETFEGSPK
jgi:hypothetical protein